MRVTCGCCGRTLLNGETFRMAKRRWNGERVVCAVCEPAAAERGWEVSYELAWRQMPRMPKLVRTRAQRSVILAPLGSQEREAV